MQRFALQAAVLLVLIGFIPNAQRVYPQGFHAQAAAASHWWLRAWDDPRWIRFEWVEPETRRDRSDTQMKGGVGGESEHRWRAVFSVRRRGYWPLSTFVAVVLATPMGWRRRAWALPAGAGTLHGFLMIQVAVVATCAFGASQPLPEGPAALWGRAMSLASALFNSPVPSYSLVFVLWTWLARPSQRIDLDAITRLMPRRPASR